MTKTIISLINAGLKEIIKEEVNYSFLRKVFKLRYNAGVKSLSKFSFISVAVGRSNQTVRLSILKSWAILPNIKEIIDLVSQSIAEKMEILKLTSIAPSFLVGDPLYSGMTEDDVLTFIHDMNSYSENSAHKIIFIVRKHGISTLSIVDKIDQISSQKTVLIKPVPLHPKAFSAVHLAKEMHGSGSLSADLMTLSNAIGLHGSNILLDRIGSTNNEGCSTLASVGEHYGVTRERIRQVTIGLLRQIMSVESISLNGPISSLKRICANVNFLGKNVITLTDLIQSDSYLACFKGNEKGLFILMSAAGIHNIIQNAGFYMHDKNVSRDHGVYEINLIKSGKYNKIKEIKTPEHQQMMAVLPLKIIAEAKKASLIKNISANMLYTKTLEKFYESNPTSIPAEGNVLWEEVGKTWRMVNIRLTKVMIDKINAISDSIGVSRASLVYAVMNHEFN